jgi:hypothetical protein
LRRKNQLIILSLLISLFIYLFYRTEKTVINEMVIAMISWERYTLWRGIAVNFFPLNDMVIYSLPEALWVFCITLTSKPFYLHLNKWRIDCVFAPLIFCIGLELLQLFHFTNGRFDFNDIWMSFLFWMIGNYAFRDESEKQNILTPLNSRTIVCLATYSIVYLSYVSH